MEVANGVTLVSDPVVVLDDAPIAAADVVAVARGASLQVGPVARARVAASRAIVDRHVTGPNLVYGLNAGLGHMRDQRVPADVIGAIQLLYIRAHAGGIGTPLPREVVRAAMAVRLAGIARGGAGASPEVVDIYVAMLNAGVHPVVPEVGSVGASDLMHMAAIALVAIGEGHAEVGGEVVSGREALARAGIEPVVPGPKDGLTMISANGVSIGAAALALDRANVLAEAADLVVAVSLEAIGANLSILDPVVARAKPVPAQALVADRIRSLLAASGLCAAGAGVSVQDPLSFRVVPQVHGAFREVLRFAAEAVDQELAASDDNPLVDLESGRMISNGNFHPMLLALAVDAVRPALVHVAQLSDRRNGQLWDRLIADPEAMTDSGLARLQRYGSPLLRYAGAARTAELRTLADPATLDVTPLDIGVEDHATNAPLAVRRTDQALAIAEDLLAAELLTACAVVGWRDEIRVRMAPRTARMLERVVEVLDGLGRDTANHVRHEAARALLRGELQALVPIGS